MYFPGKVLKAETAFYFCFKAFGKLSGDEDSGVCLVCEGCMRKSVILTKKNFIVDILWKCSEGRDSFFILVSSLFRQCRNELYRRYFPGNVLKAEAGFFCYLFCFKTVGELSGDDYSEVFFSKGWEKCTVTFLEKNS